VPYLLQTADSPDRVRLWTPWVSVCSVLLAHRAPPIEGVDMAKARVTGTVLDVEDRHGIKNGIAWSMTTVKVLVASADVTDVTIPETILRPKRGEVVDWLVGVSGSGGFLNFRYEREWDGKDAERFVGAPGAPDPWKS
jgi:hypothetical protein